MSRSYILDVVDVEDGSGDKAIQFSEEFLTDHDWRVDDVIKWEINDGEIIIRNLDWEKRNESISKQAPIPLDQPLHDT